MRFRRLRCGLIGDDDNDDSFLAGVGGGGGIGSVSGFIFEVDPETPLCERLDTCGELPRILSLCVRHRETAREECQATVGFDRFLPRRRQASAVADIPYRTHPQSKFACLLHYFSS